MPAPAEGLQRSIRLLEKTPNLAAADTLLRAVETAGPQIRTAASAALARRGDEGSHAAVIRSLADSPDDIAALAADPKKLTPLRSALAAGLKGNDAEHCRACWRFATQAGDGYSLAPMAARLARNDHPRIDELGAAVVQLARSLSLEIEAYHAQRGEEKGGASPPAHSRSRGEDPAFARRAALAALAEGVAAYRRHRRDEMVEAFLMLAPFNHTTLLSVLRDPTHHAHESMLDLLMTTKSRGAMDILTAAFSSPDAPAEVLELAAARTDRLYLERMLGAIGVEPGVRIVESIKRVRSFAWTCPEHNAILLELDGQRQATAVRLASLAGGDETERLDLIAMLLESGQTAGRHAACSALKRIATPRAEGLLRLALQDASPEVVAAAAAQLRRHEYPQALVVLVKMLDHDAEVVRVAAQDALSEFSFEAYQQSYAQMDPITRASAGKLVGLADRHADRQAEKLLRNPLPKQRIVALELIEQIGIVDALFDEIVRATTDTDINVRIAAIRLLAKLGEESPDREGAVHALAVALADEHRSVQTAAQQSLREMDALSVAKSLSSVLQAEFDGESP